MGSNGQLFKSTKISKTKGPQRGEATWLFSPVAGKVLGLQGIPLWFSFSFFLSFFFFVFLGLNPWHVEVPRLGVKSELQLLAYTTATAMRDPSHVCDLHPSSRQHWILNPLSKARDGSCILVDPSQIRFH